MGLMVAAIRPEQCEKQRAEKVERGHSRRDHSDPIKDRAAGVRRCENCIAAEKAGKNAVAKPIAATQSMAAGECRNSADERAIMYTPAVTIVAAWINAETGVGPAIASGSHTYRGI